MFPSLNSSFKCPSTRNLLLYYAIYVFVLLLYVVFVDILGKGVRILTFKITCCVELSFVGFVVVG